MICEVDDGAFFVGDLFRRKFGDVPPDVPHHIVSFYRDPEGRLFPASYVHFRPFGDTYLVGGASTDGRVIARMSEEERSAVKECGGLYLHALRYAFDRFADRCQAYFGYCGDARALEVDLAAGFVETEHPHLLAYFHKPLEDYRLKRTLIAKIHSIGPF